MSQIRNFLRHFRKDDPVATVCDHVHHNRVTNILQGIAGVGCRIVKPTNAEGLGWQVIVDGSSDVATPDGWTPPWGYGGLPDPTGHYKNEVLTLSDDGGPAEWAWPRYTVPST